MYNAITKGDNTGAFGNVLLRAYLNNPMGYVIPKAVFQCGQIQKTFENPTFPLDINFSGAETKTLNYQNECSMALWDEYGRKYTAHGNFTLYAENERVFSPDTPISDIPEGEGQAIRVDFDFCQEGLDVVLTIEAKPRYTSDLINDSGFVNNQAQNLVYYTKTSDMNALLAEKADLSDFDELQTVVEGHTEEINIINNVLPTKANDNAVVHLEGDETIEGDKTFQANIVIGLDGAITCHQGYNLINETQNKVIVGNGREALNITSFGRATANNNPIATDNTVANDIAEHNADETAHPFIQNLVTLEVTDRENAVNDLQEQIDAIVASSDVKDYVNSHAELLQYDTSTLGNRDIIVVLSDETHNNATSYYRWIIADNAFTYIGSVGPFTTPAEVAEGYVPKTRLVNGKALTTDIELTAEDVGALPSSTIIPTVNNGKLTILVNDETQAEFTANQSTNTTLNISTPTLISELENDLNYQTKTQLDTALLAKQDVLNIAKIYED